MKSFESTHVTETLVTNPNHLSRALRTGDRLIFTGEIIYREGFRHPMVEFIDLNTRDKVTVPAHYLCRAKGTIELFRRNFDTLKAMMERAAKVKVIFNVEYVYISKDHVYRAAGIIPKSSKISKSCRYDLVINCEN